MAMEVVEGSSVRSFQWKLQAPPELVWEVTSDFVGLRKWAPSIVKSCEMLKGEDPFTPGCVRKVDNFHQAFTQQAQTQAQFLQDGRQANALSLSSSDDDDEEPNHKEDRTSSSSQEQEEDEAEEGEAEEPLYAIERLLELDHEQYTFTYTLEDSNLPLISHIEGYTATVKLSDAGDGCTILTWSFVSRPRISNPLPAAHKDAHDKAVLTLYESAIADLKRYLCSSSTIST